MIQILLRYGADISLVNHLGFNAATIAGEKNHLAAYALLRKRLS